MYGPWVRIPEGSQKESEKQSESDDFLLSFYFILFLFLFLLFFIARAMISYSLFTSFSFSLPSVLLRGLFLLFFIARAMISCSLFTSNSFSFCYLNKAQTMRSIVDAMLGLSQKTGFMKYSQRAGTCSCKREK